MKILDEKISMCPSRNFRNSCDNFSKLIITDDDDVLKVRIESLLEIELEAKPVDIGIKSGKDKE